MMRAAILILLLLASPALALTPLDAGSMDADVRIENTVTFAPDGPRYRVESAGGVLLWYPRGSYLQEVDDLAVDPDPVIGDGLRFSWTDPDETERVRVTARVRTRNAVVPVRDRIPFPISDVPPELDAYLAYWEFTDTSATIQRQAQELAAGKTDAYEVVYALADWTTRNVNYSLDSLRAPAIQRASQVMATRQGKCDELTALFISMNRALGIPARFVAGYSYTDSDMFAEAWGGHGWAEVWLPGAGWVPFDVTYGEYGYLDAGHIPMATSPDAKETSVTYEAYGADFRVLTRPLDITVTPTRLSPRGDPGVRISLDAPRSRVGFGSAVLILATITNERDYYVSTRLDLARTSDTDLLSDTYANVLLHPNEAVTLPFLVRIDDDLDPGYRYEFPFVLRGRLGVEATVTVDVTADGRVYSADEFGDAAAGELMSDFSITCDRGAVRYAGEVVRHGCAVTGMDVDTITVCLGGECERVVVTDGAFALDVPTSRAGTTTASYTARAGGRSADFYVTTRAVAPTVLRVVTDVPAVVTPDDVFTFGANMTYSGAMPLNITAKVLAGRASAVESFARMDGPVLLRFDVSASVLRPGVNEIAFTVDFVDEIGTERSETVAAVVELAGLGWDDRVVYWFAELAYDTGRLFSWGA